MIKGLIIMVSFSRILGKHLTQSTIIFSYLNNGRCGNKFVELIIQYQVKQKYTRHIDNIRKWVVSDN